MGARVIDRGWLGYAGQKNFAAEQASNEWILNIDADERVSIELSAEIVRWMSIRTAVQPREAPPKMLITSQSPRGALRDGRLGC